jgi:hypothetical protein
MDLTPELLYLIPHGVFAMDRKHEFFAHAVKALVNMTE